MDSRNEEEKDASSPRTTADAFPTAGRVLAASCLVGHTGFVGSNLKRQVHFTDLYNSSNIRTIHGRTYDTLVCCGISAVKWKANQDPQADRAAIDALIEDLQTDVTVTRLFVCVSTIDVYPDPSMRVDESFDCGSGANHAYGTNRLHFEHWVRKTFPDRHLIVRLPALVGHGLKKNYVYDLMHDNTAYLRTGLKPDSWLQWYSLHRLWDDILTVRGHTGEGAPIRIVNLFPEPIHTAKLVVELFPRHAHLCAVETSSPLRYAVGTGWGQLFAGRGGNEHHIQSAATSMDDLRAFVAREPGGAELFPPPLLAVSNIAWQEHDDPVAHAVLGGAGVRLVEVAPTRIRPEWIQLDVAALQSYRHHLQEHGLAVGSLQALLYKQPDLQLFDPDVRVHGTPPAVLVAAANELGSFTCREAQAAHLRRVIRMARLLASDGAHLPTALVYGAPRCRQLHGTDPSQAWEMATEFFRDVGDYAARQGVVLCLEANPPQYGCDFITSGAEAAAMVRAVGSPGFRLHLDTACMHLAGDDPCALIARHADILYHMHVSEPQLGPVDGERQTTDHRAVAQALVTAKYKGRLTIEMRHSGRASMETLRASLAYVRAAYAPLLQPARDHWARKGTRTSWARSLQPPAQLVACHNLGACVVVALRGELRTGRPCQEEHASEVHPDHKFALAALGAGPEEWARVKCAKWARVKDRLGRVAVIGGGWYGCHMARALLRQGVEVKLFEKRDRLFGGSSGANQFRLHLGFHYPRSHSTRTQALRGFSRFRAAYPTLSVPIETNLYAIGAGKSLIDFQTYLQVLDASRLPYRLYDAATIGLRNVTGCVICQEHALVVQDPERFFRAELADVLSLGTEITRVHQRAERTSVGTVRREIELNGETFDWCINCTYNQSFPVVGLRCFYEVCLTLVYERVPDPSGKQQGLMAITVMDGPFWSLYPWIRTLELPMTRRLYTLTSVRHTPVKRFASFEAAEAFRLQLAADASAVERRRPLFEEDVMEHYPGFRRAFRYRSCFTSLKTKLFDASDDRECVVRQDGALLHVWSGKINTLFAAEDRLLDLWDSQRSPPES